MLEIGENGKTKKKKKRRVGARFVHNTRYKKRIFLLHWKCRVPIQDTGCDEMQTKIDKMQKDAIMRDINIKFMHRLYYTEKRKLASSYLLEIYLW